MSRPVQQPAATRWGEYLEHFHSERAGITERILSRCRSGELTPYDWCAEALAGAPPGPLLDIACGSGPLAEHGSHWIGLDRSEAELALARARGHRALVRCSATELPLRSGQAAAVVCAMALQVIQPLPVAVAELARSASDAGRVVLLLPAGGSLGWRDALTYLRLQLALRRRIRYPNDRPLAPKALEHLARSQDLEPTSDRRRAFHLPIDSAGHVDELIDSLYLPDLAPARRAAARRALAGRIGTRLAVPLRRVVLDPVDPACSTDP